MSSNTEVSTPVTMVPEKPVSCKLYPNGFGTFKFADGHEEFVADKARVQALYEIVRLL